MAKLYALEGVDSQKDFDGGATPWLSGLCSRGH